MKPHLSRLLLISLVIIFTPLSSVAADDISSAENEVRSFYSWYVPFATTIGSNDPAFSKVIRLNPDILSSSLRQKLAADLARKMRSAGTIEGLDFDPFLGSQDPCPHYEVTGSKIVKSHYLVEVRPICAPGAPQANIIVSLVKTSGRFVIDNIIYGDGHTLRRALALLG